MKNEIVQKELFEEFKQPKKKRRKNRGILTKNYAPFNIAYEQIIFIAIAVIMLMVLVFSLGVERGKRLASTAEVIDLVKEPEPLEETVEAPVKENKVVNHGLFTIQVIAYRSKKSSQEELIRLGKKGFNPFIIAGGGYYQICVGEYGSKDEAREKLLELKKTHKDSFIRKR